MIGIPNIIQKYQLQMTFLCQSVNADLMKMMFCEDIFYI